ncbi:MAG: hypothetical protein GY757_25855, partial [bacterium]|nr:hypothetical protein [bacterium]
MKKSQKKNIVNILALTPMQEGMLFHYLKEPGSGLYFEQLSLELTGTVEKEYFEKAWNTLIQANGMLRTQFRWERIKKPVQVILKQHIVKPRYRRYSGPLSKDSRGWLEEIKSTDREEGFDLRQIPFRITLCQLEPNRSVMIVSNHHILYDGWSSGIILKEFFSAYEQLLKGEQPALTAKTGFQEYIKWHRDRDTKKENRYWKNYLKELAAKKEPRQKTNKSLQKRDEVKTTGNCHCTIPEKTRNKLDRFLQNRDITLASLLYSVWGILIKQYDTAGEILFDTSVSGRSAKIKGIEDMVGLFINTLPVYMETKPGDTVTGFLERTGKMLQEWNQYENSSRHKINEYMEEIRRTRQNRVDSVMVIENYPLDKIAIKAGRALSVKTFSYSGRTLYDITALITVFEGLKIDLTYNKKLFDKEAAEKMCGYYAQLLEKIADSPENNLEELELVPEEERRRLLTELEQEDGTAVRQEYTAPRNQREEQLAAIWAVLLKLEQETIGIHMDFFDFGGHSLKASLLAAQIHKEFEVKMPLSGVFQNPTIAEQAGYIETAVKETYAAIDAVEKKEYYPVSTAQKRMYTLYRMAPESISYNVSVVLAAEGSMPEARLHTFETAFNKLIRRHESLRTSFDIIGMEAVQVVQEEVAFAIERYSAGPQDPEAAIIKRFIRPFDLGRAPLLRVGVIKQAEAKHLLMFDAHHIVSDG